MGNSVCARFEGFDFSDDDWEDEQEGSDEEEASKSKNKKTIDKVKSMGYAQVYKPNLKETQATQPQETSGGLTKSTGDEKTVPALMRNAMRHLGFQVFDLDIGQIGINPTDANVKAKLFCKMDLPSNLEVKQYVGQGYNNDGLWTIPMSLGEPCLFLKLVANRLGESKKFQDLAAAFPGITSDPQVAFPSFIFRCTTCKDKQPDDLLVMQKVDGVSLHTFTLRQLRQDGRAGLHLLTSLFEQVGATLADFHARYGNKQHGDFQPANIIYNETTGKITFIDLGNMGNPKSPPGADVTQLKDAIRYTIALNDPSIAQTLEQQFVNGYDRRKRELIFSK